MPAIGGLKARAIGTIRSVVTPAVTHWRAAARARAGLSRPVTRRAFVATLDRTDALEIGPLASPILTGPGVRYFDVLDQADLRRHAVEETLDPSGCPFIDYVSSVGDLAVVDRTFSSVFSSHAVEHQPDLIRHLQKVGDLLPDGGNYAMIVPDKRYSFDHFLDVSDYREVRDAYDEGRRVHTPDAVLRARLRTCHNDALKHWLGRHGHPGFFGVTEHDAHADAARAASGEYVDVHAWTFTPASFRAIVSRAHADGLSRLRPDTVTDTMFGELEFYAVLRKA